MDLFLDKNDHDTALPTDKEAAAFLRDKQLSFSDGVTEVRYSEDGMARVVILESEHGFFTSCLQEIFFFDEDELNYFPDKYPAWWHTVADGSGLYGTQEIALREIMAHPKYKARFLDSELI